MCMGGSAAPNVPAPPKAPTASDPVVTATLDADRRRRAATQGRQSTILNGGAGLTTPAPTALKTVLGA